MLGSAVAVFDVDGFIPMSMCVPSFGCCRLWLCLLCSNIHVGALIRLSPSLALLTVLQCPCVCLHSAVAAFGFACCIPMPMCVPSFGCCRLWRCFMCSSVHVCALIRLSPPLALMGLFQCPCVCLHSAVAAFGFACYAPMFMCVP